ncbi:hypothetical protein BDV06DRAFT_208227 [Aspergillus oleicola]
MVNTYGTNAERATLISQISSSRSTLISTATRHANWLISRARQESADHIDDPPPPYTQGQDHVVPSTETMMPCLPSGLWDVACNIGVQEWILQLNDRGEPTWTPAACTATDGKQAYRRDEFIIVLDLPRITVTKQAYNWTCDANTDAGQLLTSKRDTVSLRNLGEHLLVFEQTIVATNLDRPKPKPREDEKRWLKVELQSSNIWIITGTDIYQVEGYENDVVIRTPRFYRLWDMARKRFRWEKFGGGGHIWGFTQEYIVVNVGKCHLYKRKNGHFYGDFSLPIYKGLTELQEKHHFGPVVSASGLFLYKPGQKGIFIFQIGDRKVDARIWESTADIQGSLLLRGQLENLELELIGQKPTWTKYDDTWPVYKEGDFIKRRIR